MDLQTDIDREMTTHQRAMAEACRDMASGSTDRERLSLLVAHELQRHARTMRRVLGLDPVGP